MQPAKVTFDPQRILMSKIMGWKNSSNYPIDTWDFSNYIPLKRKMQNKYRFIIIIFHTIIVLTMHWTSSEWNSVWWEIPNNADNTSTQPTNFFYSFLSKKGCLFVLYFIAVKSTSSQYRGDFRFKMCNCEGNTHTHTHNREKHASK
jgi:hypothetical protein